MVNLVVGAIIAISGVFYLGTYIVDKTQYAIEIRLGDAIDTITKPGLQFKIPFITRIFYVENRIQDFDADPGSVFTKDKKEMIVDTYSKWRVEDPLKFYQTVRTVSGALARLDDIIYSQTREILGKHTLLEIVSGNRKEIRETITINSRKNAEKFGIDVTDVRIKRADLPQSNSLAVYGRMEAERQREAKRYRSEGNERALEIRSAADRDRIKILSEANRLSEEVRGKADAEATKTYADSYRQDPEFFAFSRSHEVYRETLGEDTTLLLSTERPFFKHFK
jgi:membrane protease subunit HflC